MTRTISRKATLLFATALMFGSRAAAQDDTGPVDWPPEGVSFYGAENAPDISGIWLGQAMGIPGEGPQSNSGRSTDGRPPAYWNPWPLPYTAQFQRIVEERAEATRRGVALGDTGARCLPFGLPWQIATKFYPDEIVQVEGATIIFNFAYGPLVIWTDGRGHPEDFEPGFKGHSIGYWSGNTLHIDTVGLNGISPMDSARNPRSDAMRIEWSITRVSDDRLHFHSTLYDEVAFTEPVTMTNIWARQDASWEVLDDQSCFENLQRGEVRGARTEEVVEEAPAEDEDGFVRF